MDTWLAYCIQKAREFQGAGRVSVYSVVVDKRGKLLGESANCYKKTHPLQYRYAKRTNQEHKVFLHAEIAALIRALKTGKEIARVYVARVLKTGEVAQAKPCCICTLMLEEAGNFEIITT